MMRLHSLFQSAVQSPPRQPLLVRRSSSSHATAGFRPGRFLSCVPFRPAGFLRGVTCRRATYRRSGGPPGSGGSFFRSVGKRSSRVVHTHETAGSNPAAATIFPCSRPFQSCGPP